MYKLIVVDDEKVIRNGICNYIDWEGMGFNVVASFEDGKEAIEYIENNCIDVVLTDIEMAEVSGLELAKYIQEKQSRIKAVIISGYKEFEYARKAVEYGVEHYLLKPVRMEEVKEVFGKIKNELDRIRADGAQIIAEKKSFEELLPELTEQFWISLLVGGLRSRQSIIKRKNILHMGFDMNKPCAIIDIKWKDKDEEYLFGHGSENYHNLLNNIFGGITEDVFSYMVYLSSDIIKVIAVTNRNETKDMFEKRLKVQIEEKCQAALHLLQLKFQAKIEKIFENIIEMTKYNCILPQQGKWTEKGNTKTLSENYEILIQKYKLLMGVINDGDFEELDNLIDTIFYEFRSVSIEQVKQLCIDMFSMLSNKLIKMGIDYWKDMNEKVSYQEILEANNLMDLKAKCKSMLGETITITRNRQNVNSRSFIEQAIAYMKEHVGEDISLEKIADKLFLNPAYFSRLFKQHTGTTFTDYLIELRMEKAKELLSLGRYKVYEVSQMIGYRSEKYFFRIFKQYTGCSPAEYYRSRNLNE